MGIFMCFNSKKHWSKVCLLYFEFDFFTSAEVCCFWDNETPVELHAFGFHAEQVWQKFWGEIFRMGFLVGLIMPQTASTISSPSEGCSCKTRGSGYILFSSQNETFWLRRYYLISFSICKKWKNWPRSNYSPKMSLIKCQLGC